LTFGDALLFSHLASQADRDNRNLTTLLVIAGSLEEPTSGEVVTDGEWLRRMSRDEKTRLPRDEPDPDTERALALSGQRRAGRLAGR
jgi:hypothetical protein